MCSLQTQANAVIDGGDHRDQGDQLQVPTGVEEIIREKNQPQSERTDARKGPVQKEDPGQEDKIRRRREKQFSGYIREPFRRVFTLAYKIPGAIGNADAGPVIYQAEAEKP